MYKFVSLLISWRYVSVFWKHFLSFYLRVGWSMLFLNLDFFSCSSSFLVFFSLTSLLGWSCYCSVGAAKRFCIWCRYAFFFFSVLSAIASCTLILWWHLMCHVVHYHYQHVFSFCSWLLMPFSPDLLAASVFVEFLSCIPAWRFIHSRTRIKWCVGIFLLKNC